MTDCPECGRTLGEIEPSEVHAEVVGSADHETRAVLEFCCAECDTNIIIEDIAVDSGVLARGTTGFLSRFKGGSYRA